MPTAMCGGARRYVFSGCSSIGWPNAPPAGRRATSRRAALSERNSVRVGPRDHRVAASRDGRDGVVDGVALGLGDRLRGSPGARGVADREGDAVVRLLDDDRGPARLRHRERAVAEAVAQRDVHGRAESGRGRLHEVRPARCPAHHLARRAGRPQTACGVLDRERRQLAERRRGGGGRGRGEDEQGEREPVHGPTLREALAAPQSGSYPELTGWVTIPRGRARAGGRRRTCSSR